MLSSQNKYNKRHKDLIRESNKRYRQRRTHICNLYNNGYLISKSELNKSYISNKQLQYILNRLISQNQQEYQLLHQVIKQNKEILSNQSSQTKSIYPSIPVINHSNYNSSNHPAYQTKPDNDYISNVSNSKDTHKAILNLFKGNTLADTVGNFIVNNYDDPAKMTKQKVHELINQLIEININKDKHINNGTLSNRQWNIITNYLAISNSKYNQISNKDFDRLDHGRSLFNQRNKSQQVFSNKHDLPLSEKMYYKQNHMDDVYR